MLRTLVFGGLSLWIVSWVQGAQILSRMPEVVGDQRVPLGVGLKNCDDPGVHIKSVSAGAPAARLQDENSGEIIKLEAGDHILAVNDETVSVFQDVIDRVKDSEAEIRLQIRDQRTGKIRYLVTQLVGESQPLEEESEPEIATVRINRLGIVCYLCDEGIHINEIADGAPVSEAVLSDGETLEIVAGDHVLSVNGKAIRTLEMLQEAIETSPVTCAMRIKDSDSGALEEVTVQLN